MHQGYPHERQGLLQQRPLSRASDYRRGVRPKEPDYEGVVPEPVPPRITGQAGPRPPMVVSEMPEGYEPGAPEMPQDIAALAHRAGLDSMQNGGSWEDFLRSLMR